MIITSMTTGHGPFRSTLLTASKQISIWTGPIPGKSGRQQCFPRAAYCSDSLHSYKYDSLHIEAVDIQRGVYRLSGESDYFAAPAQAVHKFEIIQYANSTGDIF